MGDQGIPAVGTNVFISMQFSANIGQIICWRPTFEFGPYPRLEILDPLLNRSINCKSNGIEINLMATLLKINRIFFSYLQRSMSVRWTRNVTRMSCAWMRSVTTDASATPTTSSGTQTPDAVQVTTPKSSGGTRLDL